MQNEKKSAPSGKGKKGLPIIIAAAVIILGIGAWAFSQSKKGAAPTQTQNGKSETESGNSENEFVGSLKDALKLGVAMKCTWEDNAGNYSETYIKSGKVYYKTSVEGKVGYVIAVDKCIWSWDEDSSQGIKVCDEESVVEEGEIPSAGGISTQDFELNCAPSTVNDSMFEVPSNVSFLDPMDMIPEGFDVDNPKL